MHTTMSSLGALRSPMLTWSFRNYGEVFIARYSPSMLTSLPSYIHFSPHAMAICNELECGSSSDSQSVDERSPLLTELCGSVPVCLVREEQVVEETNDEQKSTSRLVYMMVGLWIGTFCAGLGKFQHRLQSTPLLS